MYCTCSIASIAARRLNAAEESWQCGKWHVCSWRWQQCGKKDCMQLESAARWQKKCVPGMAGMAWQQKNHVCGSDGNAAMAGTPWITSRTIAFWGVGAAQQTHQRALMPGGCGNDGIECMGTGMTAARDVVPWIACCRAGWLTVCTTVLCFRFNSPTLCPPVPYHYP